jgi:predicted nucleotidyltransferase
MIGPVTNNLDAIRKACEDHDVDTLWVFGSAVTGGWVEGKSDVNFLAEFGPSKLSIFRQHMGLIVRLEDVLGVRIDVVDVESITKPYFREEVERTKMLLYERLARETNAAGKSGHYSLKMN